MLFDDWDVEEWSRFDNYMIECLQLFLAKGLISCAFKSLETKKFQKETSIDFHEWVLDAELPENTRFNPTPFYEQFTTEYPDERKFSQKRFSQWLDAYAKFRGGITDRGSSNGSRWTILLIPKKETYIDGKGQTVGVPDFNQKQEAPF
jgi:hypothetical protein